MNDRLKTREIATSLRRIWPVKRTMLFAGGVGYAVTLAALQLPLWCAALPAVILGGSLLIPHLRRPLWLFICCVAVLFWSLCAVYQATAVSPLEKLDGESDTISGWVEAVPTQSRYLLRVTEAELVPTGTRLLLYCPDLYAPAEYDTVTAHVQLEMMDDTQTTYRAQGIHLQAYPTGYEETVTVTGQLSAAPVTHWPRTVRNALARLLRQHLPGDEGALLAALCLGQRDALPEAVTTAFRDSGVAHLLVVSGLHLSLMTGCILWLLRRCGVSQRTAAAVTIPFVILFMLLVGLTAPVIRAGVMCLVWLTGRLLRRKADAMNSLGLAANLLMLYNPYMVLNASFLLSFSATAGVLCLSPRLLAVLQWRPTSPGVQTAFSRLYNAVAGALTACTGALVLLLPLLCVYFGNFPLIAPLTNLLTALPSSCALLAGWAGVLLCAVPGLGWLGQGVLLVAGIAARGTMDAAALCSRTPLPVYTDEPWHILLVTGLCLTLAACILYRHRPSRRRLLAGLLVISLLALGADNLLAPRQTVATIRTREESAAVLLETPAGDALLITHSKSLPNAITLVEETGTTHLAYIFIGSGETVHAGYLTRLLRTVETEQVYCLSNTDWTIGCGTSVTLLPVGSRLSLGALSLTAETANHWRLHRAGTSLLLCSGETVLPADTATDWAVYLGSFPKGAATAAISQSVLLYPADNPPKPDLENTPTAPFLLLPNEQITLTAFGDGEWSIQPWR